MEQMKKSFSRTNAILLAVLALVLVGLAYYFLVFQPSNLRIEELRQEQLNTQTQIDTLILKAQIVEKMRQELPSLKETNQPIPDYDNLKPVMAYLNSIMMASQQFEISFEIEDKANNAEGVPDTGIVRRLVTVNFICASYQDAKNIIENLHNVPYRSQVNQVTLTSKTGGEEISSGDINIDVLQGSVSIVFFEQDTVPVPPAPTTEQPTAA